MSENNIFDNTPPPAEESASATSESFAVKDESFPVEGESLSVKGTGFSPYINAPNEDGALSPEETAGAWESANPLGAGASAPPQVAGLFHSFSQPEVIPSKRIPHLGHLALLFALTLIGFVCMTMLLLVALYFHWGGVTTPDQVKTNTHYLLGSEAVLYLVTFTLGFFIFPLSWNKSLFAGIHWRGATALRLWWQLPVVALGCFALAALDEVLLPGPEHAPIEELFRSPGAAWLLFAFGVTIAPFFEEMFFRGFLLPAFCTACDWLGERFTHRCPRPLDANGHPQWSIPAMAIASVLTSLPFALMHVEQQGYSLGPFLLLIAISLVLCAVRLTTRSLAASTLVHACYNLLLFLLVLAGTGGFRHLDKL